MGEEILPDEPQQCPLCDRLLIPGPTVDEHHLVPKSKGGREKFLLHKVCHQAIHKTFRPSDLAKHYCTWESLRTAPELAKFIAWVQKRPPEFMD